MLSMFLSACVALILPLQQPTYTLGDAVGPIPECWGVLTSVWPAGIELSAAGAVGKGRRGGCANGGAQEGGRCH